MSSGCPTRERLRRAYLAQLTVIVGTLWLAAPAFADSGGLPLEPSPVPLIVTAILFVVAIAGLSLLQFRSVRRRHLRPEPENKAAPSVREEDES
jgi:hypothetical protein